MPTTAAFAKVTTGTAALLPKVPTVALTVASVATATPGPVAVTSPVRELMELIEQVWLPTTLTLTYRHAPFVPPMTGVVPTVS